MGIVEGAYALAGLLLVLGGALKLVDPSGTVGALQALRLAVPSGAVRALAGAEAVLGVAAWTAGGRLVPLLVAVSMGIFTLVVVAALWRAVPIDTCGCFGGFETPPSGAHLLVLGVAVAGALGMAADPGRPLVDAVGDDAGSGALFVGAVLVGLATSMLLMRRGRRPIGGSR